jgi:hypothetical protein
MVNPGSPGLMSTSVDGHTVRRQPLAQKPSGGASMLAAVTDVIWAAAIAVVGSALAGGIAAYASTAVARGQQAVELQKVNADRDRLRDQYGEDERRQRQAVYRDLLALLNRFDMYSTGWPPDVEFAHLLSQLNDLTAAIELLGPPEVRAASHGLHQDLGAIGQSMLDQPEATVWGKWVPAYVQHRTRLMETAESLAEAMRADVGFHRDAPLSEKSAGPRPESSVR